MHPDELVRLRAQDDPRVAGLADWEADCYRVAYRRANRRLQALTSERHLLGFSFEHDEWMLSAPVGVNMVMLPLGVRSPALGLDALDSAARFLASGGPPALSSDAAGRHGVVVSDGGWRLRLTCEQCGGFALNLHVPDAEPACLAQLRALQFLAEDVPCQGCSTELMRTAERIPSHDPFPWFDVLTDDWHVWQPLSSDPEDEGAGLSFPLGFGQYFVPDEQVRDAARRLTGSSLHGEF